MWLINTSTRKLENHTNERNVSYAILSHMWGEEEVSFQEMQQSSAGGKLGYDKITYACDQAMKDGLAFVWVDTCCINKESSAELSEAINSMYRWYSAADLCYAFLSDVIPSSPQNMQHVFTSSRWFSRGWTLQELIAPKKMTFFGGGWSSIGTKSSLATRLSARTGIPLSALNGRPLERFNVASKMKWAANRETSRVEDRAYSLLGLFGINMPLLYGEAEKAFLRLQQEIIRTTMDHSVFCWSSPRLKTDDFEDSTANEACGDPVDSDVSLIQEAAVDPIMRTISPWTSQKWRGELLAASPEDFAAFPEEVMNWTPLEDAGSFHLSNSGLEINLPVIKFDHQMLRGVLAVINCRTVTNLDGPLALRVRPKHQDWREEARPMFTVDNSDILLLSDHIRTRMAGDRLQHVPLSEAESAKRIQCTILASSPTRRDSGDANADDDKLKVLVRRPSSAYSFVNAYPAGAWYNESTFVPQENNTCPFGVSMWRSILPKPAWFGVAFRFSEGQSDFRLAIIDGALLIEARRVLDEAADVVEIMEKIFQGAKKTTIATLENGVRVAAYGEMTRIMEEWVFLIEMEELHTDSLVANGSQNLEDGEQSVPDRSARKVSFAEEPSMMERSRQRPAAANATRTASPTTFPLLTPRATITVSRTESNVARGF